MRFGVEGFEGLRLGLRGPGCFFFFVVAPFCSCPASLVSRIFFAVGPGCAKCFFLLRSVGRRDLSAGPEQKKKHHPGCFFFLLRPRGKAGEGEAGWCFFFCSGPVPAPNGASPSPAFPRGWSKKKKHLGGVFFALAPCRRPTGLLLPLPFAGAAAKKKTPWVVCFLFALAPCRHGASPSPAFPRGRSKKKNTLGGVLFFAAALRGRSLTHCRPGWRCLPLARVVFVFFAAGRGRTGVVFFFFAVAPPGRSLTVGWGDFGKARVVFFFFLLRPRRDFLDNNKKCLGYYIGSKKTRRGHSKKKHTTSGFGLVAALILLEGSGDLVTR